MAHVAIVRPNRAGGEKPPDAADLKERPEKRRQPPARSRSKIFEKSEKKSCHTPHPALFLSPKPNQTNGETNDKKRTTNVPRGLCRGGRLAVAHEHECLRANAGRLACIRASRNRPWSRRSRPSACHRR